MKEWNLNGRWDVACYPFRETIPATEAALGEPIRRLTGTVPGDIHDDLIKSGLLEDPRYGDRAESCRWVTECDWCYSTVFTPDQEPEKETELIFDGLDTFAAVYLNGELIGQTQNMLIAHSFCVNGRLLPGENRLAVYLRSVRRMAEALPDENYEACFGNRRVFLRKAQCQFGWDWAPDLPSTGIWRDVRLVTRPGHRLLSHQLKTRPDGRTTLFFEVDSGEMLEAESGLDCRVELELQGDGEPQSFTNSFRDIKNFFNFTIDHPRLWWPHDMGEPFLYSYTLRYYENGQLCDRVSGRFGIRTVEINEEPRGDEDALKFEICVNGVPVFLKGGNWVPMDLFPGTVTPERYAAALGLARDGNINALRVWGGGIYENDVFYNLCDEYGILIWQDLAFSCAAVPQSYPGFLQAVTEEIESVVRRLNNHPCIALWCGGNERYGGLGYAVCFGKEQFDYLFRGVVTALDQTRPYVPNSPFGYTNLNNDLRDGDTHTSCYYPCAVDNRWGEQREVLKQSDCSMVTEICAMGTPSLHSLRKYIPADQLRQDSPMLEQHFARNPYDGSTTTFLQQEERAAEALFGTSPDFGDFVKKSMCVQSECVHADLQYHRARKGRCSGALLWMYNDAWPCGTWSIVDYFLTPRASYYAAKRSFAAVAAFITDTADGVVGVLVNDTRERVEGTVTAGMATVDGQVLASRELSMAADAVSAVRIVDFSGFNPEQPGSYFFLHYRCAGRDEWTTFFPHYWRDIVWPEPELTVRVTTQSAHRLELELSAAKYARFVRLDGLGETARYSDNYFDIACGQVKRVTVESDEALSPNTLTTDHWLTAWED